MLHKRIFTAITLLIVFSTSLFVNNIWPFISLVTLFTVFNILEWLRLTKISNNKLIDIFLFVFLIILVHILIFSITNNNIFIIHFMYYIFIPLVVSIWLFVIMPYILYIILFAVKYKLNILYSIFSIPACLASWFSIIYLYLFFGSFFIITLCAAIWSSDICGFFIGKYLGGFKLASNISPNKTISGFIASLLGFLLWIYLTTFFHDSFGYFLWKKYNCLLFLFFSMILGLLSIIGDLFESFLKRCAGCKDSGNLLPGHGGIYDRLDSMLPVMPFALLLCGVIK